MKTNVLPRILSNASKTALLRIFPKTSFSSAPQYRTAGLLKKMLLLIIASLAMNFVLAQQKLSVRGKVIDSLTMEPIESAVITDPHTGNKSATSKNGSFVLHKVTGDTLLVSFIGYQPKLVKIQYGKAVLIALEKGVISLRDVTITNNETLSTNKTLTNLDLNMQPAKSAQDLLGFDVFPGTSLQITRWVS